MSVESFSICWWMQSAASHTRRAARHFPLLLPGDMLERWSNGLFRSTLHRVVTGGKPRDSCAFFFEPTFTTVVEVLPQCCSADNPPRFGPTTSGQHLLDRYAATHTDYKTAAP